MKHRLVAGSLAVMSASIGLFVLAPTSSAQPDVCAEFQFQEDAQAELDANPNLAQQFPLIDTDNDGIACETLPRRGGPTPVPATPRQTG